ncbi:MAG: hypothetical protein QXZ13_02295 [Candidatus Diapherotrites archaeon]
MKEESKIQTSYEVSFKIDDYDFIFSDFDARHYSQRSISDDFLITAKKAITGKEHENIEVKFLIKKDKRSTAIEEIIKKRLHDHFKKHEKTLEKELNEIRNKGIALTIIGIGLMITATQLRFFDLDKIFWYSILIAIIEPAGWFAMWFGLDHFFYLNKDKKKEYDFYKKMSSSKIHFREF